MRKYAPTIGPPRPSTACAATLKSRRRALQRNEFEDVIQRARGGGPAVTLALALGALAAVYLGFRALRFGLRVAPMLSTVVTVAGLILWVRDQLSEVEYEDDDY